MKKYLGILVMLTVIFSSGLAYAEENQDVEASTSVEITTTMEKPLPLRPAPREVVEKIREQAMEKREEVKERVMEHRDKMEDLRESARERFENMREKIAELKDEKKAESQMNRLNKREMAISNIDRVIAALEGVGVRIDAQINKAVEAGVDVSLANTHMTNFDSKLAEVKLKIAEANSLVADLSVDTNIAGTNKTKLQAIAKEIQTLFKEAREELRMAIKELRDAVKAKREADASASVEVETENSTETEVQ